MNTTADRPGTSGASTADPAPEPDAAQARVRAYLDLWERHLALTAHDGPRRGPMPAGR